jgi:hypothetical protein
VLLPLSLVEALEGVVVSFVMRPGTHNELKVIIAKDSVRELRIKEEFSVQDACVQVEAKLLSITYTPGFTIEVSVLVDANYQPANHCGVGVNNHGSSEERRNPARQIARNARRYLDVARKSNRASAR